MEYIQTCYEKSQPSRHDLFKHLAASECFAIDLDSIVLHAMNNVNVHLDGVQTLHVGYVVETFLHNFRVRGSSFHLVQFQSTRWIWDLFPQLALARAAIVAHLQTTGVAILTFDDWWSTGKQSFLQHCARNGPEFLLLSDAEQLPMSFTLTFENLSQGGNALISDIRAYFRAQALFTLAQCNTSVVFTTRLLFRDSGAVGFTWNKIPSTFQLETFTDSVRALRSKIGERLQASQTIQDGGKALPSFVPQQIGNNKASTLRQQIAIAASQDLLEGGMSVGTVKCFLVHTAFLEVLTLEQRCYLLDLPVDREHNDMFDCICAALKTYVLEVSKKAAEAGSSNEVPSVTLVDVFDGRLYMKLVEMLRTGGFPQLSSNTKRMMEDLWKAVPRLQGSLSWDFPQRNDLAHRDAFVSAFDDEEGAPPAGTALPDISKTPLAHWSVKADLSALDKCYLPLDEKKNTNRINFFRRVHDDASTLGEKPYPLVSDQDIVSTGNRSTVKGTERTIMVANTMDRVKQDIAKRKDRSENVKRDFNLKPFHLAFTSMIDLITDCQTVARNYREEINRIHRTTKEKEKPAKGSSKATGEKPPVEEEIPADIQTLIQHSALAYLDLIMGAYLFLLQETMSKWVAEVDDANNAGRRRNHQHATSAFLLIHKARAVLEENASYLQGEENKKKAKKWVRDLRDTLSVLGLRDNIRVWEDYWKSQGIDLPTPSLFIPEKPTYAVGMTAIRFQMNSMGERLERAPTVPDRRLPFTPDAWQKRLVDIIDSRQSAVVCTPTSAGKTFISLYCIKTTLTEEPVPEEPGLVVYVSPTKALLRQSLASIYAQFINKNYESSWNVYGVLEDYAFMIDRCQALVTIPEAFETLMLSEKLEHQTLMRRVRYVIFDEIHSIDDLRTGCIWERLLILIRAPFVALSATVGNPEELMGWIQSVQNVAKEQFLTNPLTPESAKTQEASLSRFKVNRIPDHGEKIHRWSDLQKYIYSPLHDLSHFDGKTKAFNSDGTLRTDFNADALITMHPMSCLSLKRLLQEGFPQDLPFLPHEMLTFYDTLRKQVRKKVMPDAHKNVTEILDPEKYFSAKNRPILTQDLVRAYESDLVKEFMTWAEMSRESKDVRKVANAVLEDLGSGKSFLIPQSNLRLFAALSEAQEDDDPILDALYPLNSFQAEVDPQPSDILLHQYLLCAYFVHWERCSLLNSSSAHADKVKLVLRFFNVSTPDSLPSPLGELVTQIRQDNLPHRSKESMATFRRPEIVPDLVGLDSDITEVYRKMNKVTRSVKSAVMDALFPTVYFERIQPDEARLTQYKILLAQELLSWKAKDRESIGELPPSLRAICEDLTNNYVLAHFKDLDPADDTFLRLPITKSKLPVERGSLDYLQQVIPELLTTLNTREMLPALIFNFDISTVEKLASSLCELLEDKERRFRSGSDFQVMLKRLEDMKQQAAALAKTAASKTRSKKKTEDEDGKKAKGDNRVQVDEFADLDGMVQEIPTILPYFTFARHGAGESSQKIQDLITEFMGSSLGDSSNIYVRCIQRGIGIHHAGMSSRLMSLMEHLYRTRNIGVLFCTETLALGIHSPCRSVVIAGDSAILTNVQFRQISGRAGRRGIDYLGHVIMVGLSSRKIRRLLTSKLQILRGHSVIDPTTSLQTAVQETAVSEAVDALKVSKKKRGTKIASDQSLDLLLSSVRENVDRLHGTSFLWDTLKLTSKDHLALQNTTWRQCTQEFLEKEGYLLEKRATEEPGKAANPDAEDADALLQGKLQKSKHYSIQCQVLVRALHSYLNVRLNALNFTLVALLRDGTLHELARTFCLQELPYLSPEGVNATDIRSNAALTVILSAFLQVDDFGLPLEVHPSLKSNVLKSKFKSEYAVELPDFDAKTWHSIQTYAARVVHHYTHFARKVIERIREQQPELLHTLPYTHANVHHTVGEGDASIVFPKTRSNVLARSPFAALTGKGDTFSCVEDLLLSLATCVYVDRSAIPAVDFIDVHTRQQSASGIPKRIPLNACTFDFLRNGSQTVFGHSQRIHLRDLNGLGFDESWLVLSRMCNATDTLLAMTNVVTPRLSYIGSAQKCVTCGGHVSEADTVYCSSCAHTATFVRHTERGTNATGAGGEATSGAYVDVFALALEQVARTWRLRRGEIGLREDPWYLSKQPAKAPTRSQAQASAAKEE